MIDLSFLLLKNTVGSRMKKGLRNFCNGDSSTLTLNQKNDMSYLATPSRESSCFDDTHLIGNAPTLEQMILQLELEEAAARKTKLENDFKHRMSSVTNNDVLKSARNALNQYPRFSLDGRDSMYRSSFRNLAPIVGGRRSVCCSSGLESRLCKDGFNIDDERLCLPTSFAGESVVWCKPGVVAKLMGLEVIPVPITIRNNRGKLGSIVRRQNLKRAEKHEKEKRKFGVGLHGCIGEACGSCSATGYSVVKPTHTEHRAHLNKNWEADRRNYISRGHI